MFTKNQRLTNLKHLRQNISSSIKTLMDEQGLSITELARMTNWPPLYLQTVIEGKVLLDIGEINYLASLFQKKVHLEFTD